MRALGAVVCLLLVTGCFLDSPTDPGPIDQQVTLAPGQSDSIAGTNLSLKFIGVTGDNRCPADVVCILGGSATVRVQVSTGSAASREVTFETGELKPVTYDSWTLELVQLQPYPFSSRTIQPEDYRATLRVKR
jgi:hypothetical protein